MRLSILSLLLPLLLAMGCSDIYVPSPKSSTGRMPVVAEVPEAEETVRGTDDPPIVTLDITSQLRERRLARTEELPTSIIVPNTNLNAVPVTSALQAVLEGSDISLSWGAGNFEDRLVTVMNLSGSMASVVQKICASAKLFCGYRNGLLEMKEKETFVIDLPSVPVKGGLSGSATNTMADTIEALAGEKVKIDHQGGNLLYTTDVDGYEQIHEYLSQLRNGRPLVVLQLYIWEVTLTSDNTTGINWSKFNINNLGGHAQTLALAGLTGFQNITTPGASLGATFTGKVEADAVLKFLATQGQVQTISNPQLTFVSGSHAEFRVGGQRRYISEVGQLASSVSTSPGNSNTVSTDSIDTGLNVLTSGVYENGVLSAVLEISTQDVISMNTTTTESGVTIDLPETSERKVSTSIRVRPGDNLVLAGLVTSRDTNNREGIPFPAIGRIPGYKKDELKNTELVILVKPSIVKFTEPEKTASNATPTQPIAATLNDQEAFIIDKDGTQTVTIPNQSPVPVMQYFSPQQTVAVRPELMVPHDPSHMPLPLVAPSEADEESPVDKSLLQRGFSHAFDELRGPPAHLLGGS